MAAFPRMMMIMMTIKMNGVMMIMQEKRGLTDGSFPSYDDDHDDDQDEWCDDDHVGEEGVDRWQLSLV